MTLSFAGGFDRHAVVVASTLVADLIASKQVADAWDQESSCAGMSVGGLSRHLASQPITIVSLLRSRGAPSEGEETIGIVEHYARASWVREDHDGHTNRSIRDISDRQAAEGREHAVVLVQDALGALEDVLTDPPATTFIPWQGWSVDTDDFLVSRLMEMVVHSDDLACSVDVPVPDFGPTVLDPVFRLLTALAVRRHGQDALVRTLTRPQRAPATVSAF